MEVVEYPRSLQWVGDMKCPRCERLTPAWRSSGMSQCFPHFYCDRCSNVIHRKADQELVWETATKELVDQIAATLPECPCGGRFRPGANPKCRHCGSEIPNSGDVVQRLGDPNMIVIDGACVFSDGKEPYRVRIVEDQSPPLARIAERDNPPMQRTEAAGMFSGIRKWLGRGSGR